MMRHTRQVVPLAHLLHSASDRVGLLQKHSVEGPGRTAGKFHYLLPYVLLPHQISIALTRSVAGHEMRLERSLFEHPILQQQVTGRSLYI